MAQVTTGTPGSPSATTTIDGKQLPAPPPKFEGVIKESAKDSKPYLPPRLVPPAPTDDLFPLAGSEPLIREVLAKLADTGITVLDVETVWIGPDFDVARLRPALETGQRLGAGDLLTMGNDGDGPRLVGLLEPDRREVPQDDLRSEAWVLGRNRAADQRVETLVGNDGGAPFDEGDGDGLQPNSFHGTHVSGTIGASTNNNVGVAGVTWATGIMSVRALGKDGGTMFDPANPGKLRVWVVVLNPVTGQIIEDDVQEYGLADYGVQKTNGSFQPLWFDLDGNETTDGAWRKVEAAGRFGPDVFDQFVIDFMRRHRDRPFLVYYTMVLAHTPTVHTPHSASRQFSFVPVSPRPVRRTSRRVRAGSSNRS